MPDRESGRAFSQIISQLAAKFNTPLFKPHITLASSPDLTVSQLTDAASSISNRLSSFTLSVNKPVCGNAPYQRFCCELEPANNLLLAADAADEVLNGGYSKRSFYHISLLYGSTLCRDLHSEFNKISELLPQYLHVQSLAVYRTSGKPSKWRAEYFCELSG